MRGINLGKLHFPQGPRSVSPYLCRRLRTLTEVVRERTERKAAALARRSLSPAPIAPPSGFGRPPEAGGASASAAASRVQNGVDMPRDLHLPPDRGDPPVLVDEEG